MRCCAIKVHRLIPYGEHELKTNMGTFDRAARIVAAIVLVWAAFGTAVAAAGVLHWLFLAVAAIFVLTAFVGTCPLYSIVGLKTCRNG